MKTNFTQRKFYIIYVILAAAIFFSRKSFANDINDFGSNANYTLNSGDSLTIVSGTYTGNISKFLAGAKITVLPGAVFNPSMFKNPAGTLNNYGVTTLSSNVPANAGFSLINSGTITFQANATITGVTSFTNIKGGTVIFKSNFTLSNGSSLQNDGVIYFEQNFTTSVPSTAVNNNTMRSTGNFVIDDVFTNNGWIYSNDQFNIISNGKLINNCRIMADGGLNNYSTLTMNNGLVWMTGAKGAGAGNADMFSNNNGAVWNNTSNGRIRTPRFTNSGVFTGAGYLYVTGISSTSAQFGDNGSSGTLYVYDVTRSNPANIFDNQTVAPRTNVVYQVFAAPDTLTYTGCSNSFITQNNKTLPIKLGYFGARAEKNEKAVLNWITEIELNNEYFTLERSEDGKNFKAIAIVMGAVTTSIRQSYEYKDNLAGVDKTKTIYYRIKQTDLDGASSYSPVRSVKFSQKQMMIQVNPNPIVDNVTVKFVAETTGTMSVRIFNTNGQTVINKSFSVNKGYNGYTVNNLGSLSKGLYVVEVMINGEISEKTKLIKQ